MMRFFLEIKISWLKGHKKVKTIYLDLGIKFQKYLNILEGALLDNIKLSAYRKIMFMILTNLQIWSNAQYLAERANTPLILTFSR